jgi:hypothetical protein
MRRLALFVLSSLLVVTLSRTSFACDICAIYTSTEMQEGRSGLRASVAEQFTRSTTLQRGGESMPNPSSERLESSITQLVLGYAPHPRLLLQANLPLIHRSYRRVESSGVVSGSESGAGDLSLHALGTVWSRISERSLQRVSVLVGVKLPTGSPDRLAEELHDHGTSHDDSMIPPPFRSQRYPRHSTRGVESGIHGHDLALGTGSTDVVLGAQSLLTYGRWYGTGLVQYFIRTEGSFDYTYANELILSGGPGYFLWLSHSQSLGLQALLTLDTKGKDTQTGRELNDTSVTFLYAGPSIHWTWGTQLSVDLAADLPALRNNTDLQIVPDYRLRTGLTWRF